MLEYGPFIGRIGTRSYAKLSPLPNSKSGAGGLCKNLCRLTAEHRPGLSVGKKEIVDSFIMDATAGIVPTDKQFKNIVDRALALSRAA